MIIYTTSVVQNFCQPRYLYLIGYDHELKKCCVKVDFGNWVYVRVDNDQDIKEVHAAAIDLNLRCDKVIKKKISDNVYREYSFVRVWGPTVKALTAFCNNIRQESYELKVSNVLKFYSELQIRKYCWLNIPDATEALYKESIYENEWVCNDWSTITEASDDRLAPEWSMFSFDIEVHSDNMGRFPSADKSPVNQIICIAFTFKDKDRYIEEVLYWGKDISEYISSVKKNDVVYKFFNTEIDMIRHMFDRVKELDPDVMVGHNIMGFDYEFIYDRWNCINSSEPFPETSRLISCKTKLQKGERKNNQYYVKYQYLDIPGRINIDTYIVSVRDIMGRMESNSLKYISTKLLNTTKNDMSHIQMFKIWRYTFSEKYISLCTDGYVPSQEELDKLYDEMYKQYNFNPEKSEFPTFETVNNLISIRNKINIYDPAMNSLSLLEEYDFDKEQERVWTDIQRLLPLWNIPRTEHKFESCLYLVLLYCIQDTRLPISIIEVTNLLNNLREFSNIVYTDITDRLIGGQGKGCENTQYFNMHKEYVLRNPKPVESEKYSGGFVLDPPERSSGDDAIVYPLDFASLYPSIIIAYNIDPSTHVPNDKLLDTLKELSAMYGFSLEETLTRFINYFYIEDSDDHMYFLKAEPDIGNGKKLNMLGPLPALLKKQFLTRKAIRANMRNLKHDKIRYAVEDAKQLAVKISMNSQYGKLGHSQSPYSFFIGAKLTTAIGRNSLRQVVDYVNNIEGLEVMYGDTDSVFIRISSVKDRFDNDINKLDTYITAICKSISDKFPQQMNMEVESPFIRFYTVKSKMYCGIKFDRTFDIKSYDYKSCKIRNLLYHKGLTLVKGDTSEFEKRVQDEIIHMVIMGVSAETLIQRIFTYTEELLQTYLYCRDNELTDEKMQYINRQYSIIMRYTETAAKKNSALNVLATHLRQNYGINFDIGEKYRVLIAEHDTSDVKNGYTLTHADAFKAERRNINWRYYLKKLNESIERINRIHNNAFTNKMNEYFAANKHRIPSRYRVFNLVRYFECRLSEC